MFAPVSVEENWAIPRSRPVTTAIWRPSGEKVGPRWILGSGVEPCCFEGNRARSRAAPRSLLVFEYATVRRRDRRRWAPVGLHIGVPPPRLEIQFPLTGAVGSKDVEATPNDTTTRPSEPQSIPYPYEPPKNV